MVRLKLSKNYLNALMAQQFQHLCFFPIIIFSLLLSLFSVFLVILFLYLNDAEFVIGSAL